MKRFFINVILFAFLSGLNTSCKRSDFLDKNPDQSSVVPSTLVEFQAILDNDNYMNGGRSFGLVPCLGEIGSDNYFITDANYSNNINFVERNEYQWLSNPYPGKGVDDWDFPYRSIFYSNVVLEGISKLNPSPADQLSYDNLKGSALFYRGHMIYQLAQVFAPHFDSSTANSAMGLPLRMIADVNEKIERASLQQTYDQLILDIKNSIPLLPVAPLYKTRPSKPAAYALLSRVYQTLGNYGLAKLYADSCLQLYTKFLDFNAVNTTVFLPIARFNDEVIFDCTMIGTNTLANLYLPEVDSNLFNSYATNDLRKDVFFKPSLYGPGKMFVGTYHGNYYGFAGIATDEVYIIRAECYARQGNVSAAMNDLNTVLIKRWKSGTFVPYTAADANDALNKVLVERRKELLWRGLRWTDLRRLNRKGANITIVRKLNGQTYSLGPNDLRYTWLIPDNILAFHPDMQQNPR